MRLLAVCLVLISLLAACGGGDSTPTSTLDSSSARPTSAPHETATPLVVEDGDTTPQATSDSGTTTGAESVDCGALSASGNPPRAADAASLKTAAACFLKAVQVCQTATLTVKESDTGILRQFTVEHGDICTIREALQPDPNAPPATADCESAEARDDGIAIFKCSHFGDYVLTS